MSERNTSSFVPRSLLKDLEAEAELHQAEMVARGEPPLYTNNNRVNGTTPKPHMLSDTSGIGYTVVPSAQNDPAIQASFGMTANASASTLLPELNATRQQLAMANDQVRNLNRLLTFLWDGNVRRVDCLGTKAGELTASLNQTRTRLEHLLRTKSLRLGRSSEVENRDTNHNPYLSNNVTAALERQEASAIEYLQTQIRILDANLKFIRTLRLEEAELLNSFAILAVQCGWMRLRSDQVPSNMAMQQVMFAPPPVSATQSHPCNLSTLGVAGRGSPVPPMRTRDAAPLHIPPAAAAECVVVDQASASCDSDPQATMSGEEARKSDGDMKLADTPDRQFNICHYAAVNFGVQPSKQDFLDLRAKLCSTISREGWNGSCMSEMINSASVKQMTPKLRQTLHRVNNVINIQITGNHAFRADKASSFARDLSELSERWPELKTYCMFFNQF